MNDELQQQLWDLLYGLLEPDEAAALKARITSDPEVARRYADICLQKELVADAARIEVAPLALNVPGRNVVQPQKPKSVNKSVSATRRKSASSIRPQTWANVVVGLAALLLMGIITANLWQRPDFATVTMTTEGVLQPKPFTPTSKLASASLITEVRGPQSIVPGMTNHFALLARTSDDQPVSAAWSLRYVDQAGAERYAGEVETDANGQAEIVIPGSALRQSGTLLVERTASADEMLRKSLSEEVESGENRGNQQLSVPVHVAAETLAAHLEVDRPIARPGETVGFRTVVLGEQSLAISEAVPTEFELYDPEGNPVPGTLSKDVTDHGVAAADAILPSNLAEGVYELAVRSPDGAFAEQRARLVVQRDGAAGMLAMSDQDREDFAFNMRDKRQLAARSIEMEAAQSGQLALAESRGLKDLSGNRMQMEIGSAAAIERKSQSRAADGARKGDDEQALAPSTAAVEADALTSAPAPPGAPIPKKPSTPPGQLAPPAAMQAAAAPKENSSKILRRGIPEAGAVVDQQTAIPPPSEKFAEAQFGGGAAGGIGGQSKQEASPADGPMAANAEVAPEAAKMDPLGMEPATLGGPLKIVSDLGDGLVLDFPATFPQGGRIVVSNERGDVIAQADVPVEATDKSSGQTVDFKRPQVVSRLMRIAIPPEASGSLFMALFDPDRPDEILYSQTWDRPAYRRAVLSIDSSDQVYAAGQEVELQLSSRNEAGLPLPAVLGVRIVNDDVANLLDDEAPVTKRNLLAAVAPVMAVPGEAANSAAEGEADDQKQSANAKRYRQLAEFQASSLKSAEKEKRQNFDGDALAMPDLGANGAEGTNDVLSNLAPDTNRGTNLKLRLAQPYQVLLATQRMDSPVPVAPKEVDVAEQIPVPVMQERSQPRDHAVLREQANSLLRQRFVARLLLAAGLMGLMAVGVSCMLRISLRPWVWLPAVAAAIACIVLGAARLPNIVQQLAERAPVTKSSVPEAKGEFQHDRAINRNGDIERLDIVRDPQNDSRPTEAPALEYAEESLAFANEPAKDSNDERFLRGARPEMDRRQEFNSKPMAKANVTDIPEIAARAGTETGARKSPASAADAFSRENLSGVSPAPTSVPVTLFWNPRLLTDANGQATIRFQMPPQGGRYRVVVDAHADGRMGKTETLISSQQTAVTNAADESPADPLPAAAEAGSAEEPTDR